MRRLILTVLLIVAFALGAAPQTTNYIRPWAFLPPTCNPTTGNVLYLNTGITGIYACSNWNTWTRVASSTSGPALPGLCTPGSTDPFYLTVGATGLYVCSAVNIWTKIYISGDVYNAPIDYASTFFYSDEFASAIDTNGNISDLGWYFTTGSTSFRVGEAGRPGILRRDTTAASGGNCSLWPRLTQNVGVFLPSDNFDVVWIIRPNNIDVNTSLRIGICNGNYAGIVPTHGAYFEKLVADTDWFCVTRNAGVQTRQNSGLAVAAAWTRFRVRRAGANINFSINGGVETSINTNLPSDGQQLWFQISNDVAVSKTADIDYAHLLITGLVR